MVRHGAVPKGYEPRQPEIFVPKTIAPQPLHGSYYQYHVMHTPDNYILVRLLRIRGAGFPVSPGVTGKARFSPDAR